MSGGSRLGTSLLPDLNRPSRSVNRVIGTQHSDGSSSAVKRRKASTEAIALVMNKTKTINDALSTKSGNFGSAQKALQRDSSR